jgi:iron complex outermembrane receptor protein
MCDDLARIRGSGAILLALLLGAASLLAQQDSHAQQTVTTVDSGGLEEVIVTARKRPERLMDVPISVQSFNSKDLAEAGIYDLQGLKDVAGFTFQQTASTGAGGRTEGSLIFRGLQSTYGDVRENSGSLFVDGIFISGGQASISTVDVDRVEVLKGPQNAYFGRNTFGGAINFITKAPSDDFESQVSASGTDRSSTDDVLTLEGPVVKGLLDGRVTLNNHIKGAEYTASDGGALGAEQTRGMDGSLNLTPGSGISVRLNAHYQQDDDSSAALGYLPGQASYGNTCVGRTFNVQNAQGVNMSLPLSQQYFCGSIPTLNQVNGVGGVQVPDANTALPPGYLPITLDNSLGNEFQDKVPGLDHTGMRRDLLRLSLLSTYALPFNSTATFNAGYDSSFTNYIWDVDRSATFSFLSSEPTVQEDWTLDARVATDQTLPLRGLLGVSYFGNLLQYQQNSLDGPLPGPVSGLGNLSYTSSATNERSYVPAVYGSVDYDIFSSLTATAEARFQSDKNTDYAPSGPAVSETNNTVMPRFIVRYKPLDGTIVYVSYSEGVQPTLLNSGYIGSTPTQQQYLKSFFDVGPYTVQPKLENFEVGIKQSLFNNRVEYSLDLYHGLWQHQATSTAAFGGPLPATGTFVYLSNEATVKGFEFSTRALITEGWSASLNVNYVHAIWDSYNNYTLAGFIQQPAGSTPANEFYFFKGNYLSRVPAWTGSFSTTYENHLTSEWDWYARADVNYTGSMWESDINIVKTDPYARVNAVLGIKKDQYSIELFAKNLFNDQHWDFAERVPNLIAPNSYSFTNEGLLVQAPDKQEIGARVNFKF